MTHSGLYLKFILILVLTAVSGLVVFDGLEFLRFKNLPFRLGLDLQGGTHLVYQGDLSQIAQSDSDDAMQAVRDVIERRVNAFGVTEPNIQVAGQDRLIVELPGVGDIAEAVRQIGLTPFLEFREENPDATGGISDSEADVSQAYLPTGLSGKHLKRSDIVFDPNTNQPQISLQFDDEGRRLFGEITRRNIGRAIAIFLDGVPISAPIVQQEITAGQAVITGNFTIDEAKELAQRLNAGALPVPIHLLEQQNIGPTLGRVSLQRSILAGFIGLFAIVIFMLVYYRLFGVYAVLALGVYILITLALFKLFGVTLTLAGVAGFILSVGMAVDANILVFERTKEELRQGHSLPKSLEDGFKRAWAAIRDSNVSSLITVFILGYFGSSLIRGFAVTLGIGIVVSMFTAIIVTRTLLRLAFKTYEDHV